MGGRCGGEGGPKPYRLTPRGAFKASAVARCGSQEISRVGLRRLPAIERIAVMDHQELDLVGVEADGKPDRRRETAQERGRRRGRDLVELEHLLAVGHFEQGVAGGAGPETPRDAPGHGPPTATI